MISKIYLTSTTTSKNIIMSGSAKYAKKNFAMKPCCFSINAIVSAKDLFHAIAVECSSVSSKNSNNICSTKIEFNAILPAG